MPPDARLGAEIEIGGCDRPVGLIDVDESGNQFVPARTERLDDLRERRLRPTPLEPGDR
jgi:hypothetical protein